MYRRSIIFFLLFQSVIFGQSFTPEDSLLFKLQSETNNNVRIEIYESLIGETYLSDPSEAYNYCNKLIELSDSLDNKMGIGVGYSWMGFLADLKGNMELSLDYYFKACDIFIEIDSVADLGACYNNIATVYANTGKNDLAMQYYWRSVDINIQFENLLVVAATFNNIGRIYYKQAKIKEAMELFYKGLSISLANDFDRIAASSYYNIAIVYLDYKYYKISLENYYKSLEIEYKLDDKYGMAFSLKAIGNVYEKMGDNRAALIHYTKSEQILKEIENPQGLGLLYADIGYIHYKNKNWEKALDHYYKGLKYLEEADDKQGISEVAFRIGQCFYQTNQLSNSLLNLEKSYQLSLELGYPVMIKNSAELLYKLYEDKGDQSKAFEIFKNYTVMKDSIENNEARKLVQQQRLVFEFEKDQLLKEQIEEDKRKMMSAKITRRNLLQNSLILVCISILFTVVLSFGTLKVSPKIAQILVFGSLLIFFEFLLVLTDPYLDKLTNGVPVYKLLANSVLAFSIFPLHSWLEKRLVRRVKMK